jgi:hypothetical protein
MKQRNRLSVDRVSCIAMLARSSDKANAGCPTEVLCLGLYNLPRGANKQVSCFRIWERVPAVILVS